MPKISDLPAIVNTTSDMAIPVVQSGQTKKTTLGQLFTSPALTGSPTVPTAQAGTNSTIAASTAFVATAIASLVASSPGTLDTLNELANALGNDPDFATTITNALAAKVTRPTGGTDGQTLIRSGDAFIWGSVGGAGASSTGRVNVKDYGAKGDGSTDDAAAIQAAINAVHGRAAFAGAASGEVYFPPGTYAIRSALTVPVNVYLVGETQGASRIVYTNTSNPINGPLITIGASGQINTDGGIKRLTVDAQGAATINTLLYGPQEGCSLTEAWLWGATNTCVQIKSTGIVGGSNKFFIHNCWLWTQGDTGMYGIDMDAQSGNMTISSTTIVGVNRSNNEVNGNPAGSAAIRLTQSGVMINDVNFEHWETAVLADRSSIWAVGMTGFWIVNGVKMTAASTAQPVFLYDMGFDGGSITYTVNDLANNVQLGYARTYVSEAYLYAPFHFTRNIWNLGRVDVATKAGAPGAQVGYDTPFTTADQTRFKLGVSTSGGWKEAAAVDANGFFGTDSAWNGQHLRLGTYRFWVDSSGRLRTKSSAPTSDTDGTVVGTQS